jgi:hypothetical protein
MRLNLSSSDGLRGYFIFKSLQIKEFEMDSIRFFSYFSNIIVIVEKFIHLKLN